MASERVFVFVISGSHKGKISWMRLEIIFLIAKLQFRMLISPVTFLPVATFSGGAASFAARFRLVLPQCEATAPAGRTPCCIDIGKY